MLWGVFRDVLCVFAGKVLPFVCDEDNADFAVLANGVARQSRILSHSFKLTATCKFTLLILLIGLGFSRHIMLWIGSFVDLHLWELKWN